MSNSFGPWSTAITTGSSHHLSTFWKRRISKLTAISQSPSRAARRTWMLLAVAAALAILWPTVHAGHKTPGNRLESAATRAGAFVPDGNRNVAVEYLPRPTPDEAKINLALESPIDVDFSETSLEDCLKFLTKKAGINIVADEQRLAEEGVALDEPVTLKLQGKRLEVVMNRLLNKFELAYFIDENELKITSGYVIGEKLVDRWYPVWDLHPTVAGASRELSAQARQANKFAAPPSHIAELIVMLSTTVQPDTWEEQSGPGSVAYVGELNCLAIRQTMSAHHDIVKLLRLWREAKRLKQAAQPGNVPQAANH